MRDKHFLFTISALFLAFTFSQAAPSKSWRPNHCTPDQDLDRDVLDVSIKGHFLSCERSSKLFVEGSCEDRQDTNKPEPMSVFYKREFYLYGFGYQCTRFVYKNEYEGDGMYKLRRTLIGYSNVTTEECRLMQETNMCEGNQMTCEGDSCHFIGSWGQKLNLPEYNFTAVTCTVLKVLLKARTRSSFVHDDHLHGCKPDDGYCHTTVSTLIWDRAIIFDFPLNFHKIYPDMRKVDPTTYLSESNKQIFKIREKTTIAGFSFLETTSGLYLYREALAKLEKNNRLYLGTYNETDSNVSFMSSTLSTEIDYLNFLFYKKQSKADQLYCSMLSNNLNWIKAVNGRFQLNNLNGERMVIESENGILYSMNCSTHNVLKVGCTLGLPHGTSRCSSFLPVTLANQTVKMYLDNKGFLHKTSPEIPCNDLRPKSDYLKIDQSFFWTAETTDNKVAFFSLSYDGRDKIYYKLGTKNTKHVKRFNFDETLLYDKLPISSEPLVTVSDDASTTEETTFRVHRQHRNTRHVHIYGQRNPSLHHSHYHPHSHSSPDYFVASWQYWICNLIAIATFIGLSILFYCYCMRCRCFKK